MQRNFKRSLTAVLAHEGGYVNHPRDPGGATNLGVTIGTARRLGIDVDGDGDTDLIDIKKLKPADAAKVYRAEYWDKLRCDDLQDGVDYAVFDFGVNSGVSRSAKYLQGIVGAADDGLVGPETLKRAIARDKHQLINALCDRRMAFLKGLGTFGTFGRGWTSRVAGVRALALEMAQQGASLPDLKPLGPVVTAPIPAPIETRPPPDVEPVEPDATPTGELPWGFIIVVLAVLAVTIVLISNFF